jgi:hypothetical protein
VGRGFEDHRIDVDAPEPAAAGETVSDRIALRGTLISLAAQGGGQPANRPSGPLPPVAESVSFWARSMVDGWSTSPRRQRARAVTTVGRFPGESGQFVAGASAVGECCSRLDGL